MVKKYQITDEDELFWEEFIKDIKPLDKKLKPKTVISRKAPKIDIIKEPKQINKTRKAQIDRKKADEIKKKGLKTEAKLDLHGLTQEQAYNKLERFIKNNWLKGVRNLLVITGKGKDFEGSGILKQMLPKWLAETKFNPMILHITTAKPNDGGEGAFYIVLRKRREN